MMEMEAATDMLLLSTKIKIPAPRRDYVVRAALFDRLSQCSDMNVIFVRGGAGTGKTTLLSSFLKEKQLKNVGWLTLDRSNSNLYSFWHYFAAAVGTFLGDDDFISLLKSCFDAAHMEHLLTLLINRMCGETDYYMVLDDVHCISDPALMNSLEFFLSAMPENLHLFMLSREDPPVYLGSMAISGRLLFIDGNQMQLSPEEGMEFLRKTLKRTDSDEELQKLSQYAEGWIGGLQLAVAASASGRPSGNLLRAGGGIAAEYLTREIFEAMSSEEQRFLVGTGYLSYFDPKLCSQLFENFSDADFDSMIDILTQKNLFIICVDEQNSIYRYHNILSDYLTQKFFKLTEEERQELLQKAAAGFEHCGDPVEALRLLSMAKDDQGIMRVARGMNGSIESWSYLDELPLDHLMEDADLAIQCFMYNIGKLDIDRCLILFDAFEHRYEGTDIFRVMQFAKTYVEIGRGKLPVYHTLTAQQIDQLNLGSVTKAMILVENATALTENMQYLAAEACLDKAVELSVGSNIFVEFYSYGGKSQLYEEIGRLNECLDYYTKAMELFRSPFMLPMIGINFYIGITGVYMRRMELEKAEESLGKARELQTMKKTANDLIDHTILFHIAEMKFLRGEDEKGAEYMAQMLTGEQGYSTIMVARLIHEMDCASLLQDSMANRFLQDLEEAQQHKSQPFLRLLRARIIVHQGRAKEALAEAEEVLTFARTQKNRIRLVEAGILKIWLLSKEEETAGRQRDISNLIREVIYYAHENKILMPFFLERKTLLPLLGGYAAQNNKKSVLSVEEERFLQEVLSVCGETNEARSKEVDALSSRELEVLQALSQGITNREIADQLCISQATVKTHVLSIFGKLGVSSRMLAVEQGRKKGLISQ
jgi:LuxR family maltose regulon positive regulatory protein